MDAVEFLKECKRICKKNAGTCNLCPFGGKNDKGITLCDFHVKYFRPEMSPERIIGAVEKWSKEHPRKTRLQDFLEKYPNAPLIPDGMKLPKACAQNLGYCESCPVGVNCYSCWNEPVEE